MCVPLGKAAQGRDDQAAIGGGLFKFQCLPRAQGTLCVRTLRRGAGEPQQGQRAIAVVGKIGVHPHPAIGTGVQARERVPGVGCLTIHAEKALAFQRGVGHVHTHALAWLAPHMAQLAGGQGRGCNTGLGRRTNRK